MPNKHLLLILDGYGIAEDSSVSAVDAAETPFLDGLFARAPHSTLEASGRAVGLPPGQMGNSEVGHMNLGAGRVVDQDITRIDKAVEDGSLAENAVLRAAVQRALANGTKLHLMGLASTGGVHSHLAHLLALLNLAAKEGLKPECVVVHAFTDGRDTDPEGGAGYVRQIQDGIASAGVGVVGSVVGRYWAMDRDKRWERTEKAYRLLTEGAGAAYADPVAYLERSYADGVTDEFVEPGALAGPDGRGGAQTAGAGTRIESGDAVVYFNFRSDRGRQLTQALTDPDFDGFDRGPRLDLHVATMTAYSADFGVPVAFEKANLADTLGEVVSRAGLTQLRAAETEKYPHVTFFFNGGREVQYDGESRILVPSPKVATYDLQPEMSAPELSERVAAAIHDDAPDLVVLNFANPDMVGHTGVFEAAVAAVEAADAAARVVVEAAAERGYTVEVIADHGNADKMRNADGSPNTAHTTALVPHLILRPGFDGPIRPGKLGDVAPTILDLMGVEAPPAMTGTSLVGEGA
ncbi:2,3-bisphosphoglycerate-independent phosphoglycerate mutase [Rubrivirga sp. S365]|uniref:2,3-bisphosphoglycerate-independent phosphoglycerate mutase n=1 Tax=Rubrivirga sp. S365 TaxID=3076080 RepID=UPI0028C974F6|nr:2,3-bisphosphoglycerate-independent phosphoglycerate mutase [Rubrivirga sp. S365]MDT7856418.1 2,3-bisphosphoglycerate-independent phosphoglycerate mutase [Rubrivirga sp. S365]